MQFGIRIPMPLSQVDDRMTAGSAADVRAPVLGCYETTQESVFAHRVGAERGSQSQMSRQMRGVQVLLSTHRLSALAVFPRQSIFGYLLQNKTKKLFFASPNADISYLHSRVQPY